MTNLKRSIAGLFRRDHRDHAAGDVVEIGQRILGLFKGAAFGFRYGADRFAQVVLDVHHDQADELSGLVGDARDAHEKVHQDHLIHGLRGDRLTHKHFDFLPVFSGHDVSPSDLMDGYNRMVIGELRQTGGLEGLRPDEPIWGPGGYVERRGLLKASRLQAEAAE